MFLKQRTCGKNPYISLQEERLRGIFFKLLKNRKKLDLKKNKKRNKMFRSFLKFFKEYMVFSFCKKSLFLDRNKYFEGLAEKTPICFPNNSIFNALLLRTEKIRGLLKIFFFKE